MTDVYDHSVNRAVSGFEMRLPSDFHHGLIILMHMIHHLVSTGVGLRHLCDWAVFVNRFSNEEFQTMFERKLSTAGLWRTAQLLSLVCVKYLGCTPKPCLDTASDDILDGILIDIFQGGNFGVKDGNRSRAGMILSNHRKGGIRKRGYLAQFFDTLNHIIYTNWPISKKLPLLLPFG